MHGDKWKLKDYNLTKLLAEIKKTSGNNIFFKFDISIDLENNSQYLINIEFANLKYSLEDQEKISVYNFLLNFKNDTSNEMQNNQANGYNIVYFESKLKDNLKKYDFEYRDSYDRHNISTLNNILNIVNFF